MDEFLDVTVLELPSPRTVAIRPAEVTEIVVVPSGMRLFFRDGKAMTVSAEDAKRVRTHPSPELATLLRIEKKLKEMHDLLSIIRFRV